MNMTISFASKELNCKLVGDYLLQKLALLQWLSNPQTTLWRLFNVAKRWCTMYTLCILTTTANTNTYVQIHLSSSSASINNNRNIRTPLPSMMPLKHFILTENTRILNSYSWYKVLTYKNVYFDASSGCYGSNTHSFDFNIVCYGCLHLLKLKSFWKLNKSISKHLWRFQNKTLITWQTLMISFQTSHILVQLVSVQFWGNCVFNVESMILHFHEKQREFTEKNL